MKSNPNAMAERAIFTISVASCLWLAFIWLNFKYLHLTHTVIGVFQEMLTIPALIIQPVLLVFSIIFTRKSNFGPGHLAFWSLLINLAALSLALVLALS